MKFKEKNFGLEENKKSQLEDNGKISSFCIFQIQEKMTSLILIMNYDDQRLFISQAFDAQQQSHILKALL